jgi:hypothetical protein
MADVETTKSAFRLPAILEVESSNDWPSIYYADV